MTNTRKYSNAQEKNVARKVGGRTVSNSGATPFRKGDVITDKFLIECKTATAERKSMSIKKEWIRNIKSEAFAMNRPYWAIAFDFGGDSLRNREQFYIIDEHLFIQLQEHLIDLEE